MTSQKPGRAGDHWATSKRSAPGTPWTHFPRRITASTPELGVEHHQVCREPLLDGAGRLGQAEKTRRRGGRGADRVDDVHTETHRPAQGDLGSEGATGDGVPVGEPGHSVTHDHVATG